MTAEVPWTARKISLAVILLLMAGTAWEVYAGHEVAETNTERLVAALSRALDQEIDNIFSSADNLLNDATTIADANHWPTPALIPWFQGRMAALPEVTQMAFVNPEGIVMGPVLTATKVIPAAPAIPLTDFTRFYHDGLAANAEKPDTEDASGPPGNALHIGDPRPDPTTGMMVVPVSRAIFDKVGRLHGFVLALINPKTIATQLSSLNPEEMGGVSVIHRDGSYITRVPFRNDQVGSYMGDSTLFRNYIPLHHIGVAHVVTKVDNVDKIVGYRTLDHFPIVVIAGVTTKTAYDQWRRELVHLLIGLIVASLGVFGLATVSDRREYSRLMLARKLAAANRDLERQVAERTQHLVAAQAEATRRADALALSNADLKQYAYVASHDLQEPLRTITSYVQILQHRYQGKLGPEADEFIGYVVEGTRRMRRLIVDLLQYSQVGSQAQPFVTVPLERVLREALDNLSRALAETGAIVSHDPLPSLAVDHQQIISLFQNLIGNAIKYRRPGIAPLIHISAAEHETEWAFVISDNGIGIAPEHADRIFGIFQRLHTTATYEGTGIGLAICRKIVRRHGGEITLLPATDAPGSRFAFTLAKAIPPADEAAPPEMATA